MGRSRPGLLLLVVAAGCVGSSQEPPAATVRDSAGVRIVETTAPAWAANEVWRLSADPKLSIGRQIGDDEYLFHGIAGVRRLADGRVVVADAGSSQIRFYDSAGAFLGAVGRAGEGPGEFRFMSRLHVGPGDTLAVIDMSGLNVLDPTGAYVRTVPPALVDNTYRARPAGKLASGEILGISGSRGFSPRDAGTVIRDSLRFYVLRPDGTVNGTIAILPSAERWGLEAAGIHTFPYLPFAANPVWAAGDREFYIGTGRDAEIGAYGSDARLVRILRWRAPRRAVTDEDRSALRSYLLASARDDNARRREEVFLAEAPIATEMPMYRSVRSDDDANVWLEIYRSPWEPQPRWHVISDAGEWLGTVETPPGLTIHQIGRDFVLGMWRDEADVQYVRMYELIKPGSGVR